MLAASQCLFDTALVHVQELEKAAANNNAIPASLSPLLFRVITRALTRWGSTFLCASEVSIRISHPCPCHDYKISGLQGISEGFQGCLELSSDLPVIYIICIICMCMYVCLYLCMQALHATISVHIWQAYGANTEGSITHLDFLLRS